MHPLSRSLMLLACLASMSASGQAQMASLPTPTKGLMPQPALGQKLFEQHCAACHGQDLRGTDKGPPFLHPVYAPDHHGDAAFQAAVRHGSRAHHWRFGDMPPVAGVTPDQVAHITAFIRQRQQMAATPGLQRP